MQNLGANGFNLSAKHQKNIGVFKETLVTSRYWKLTEKKSSQNLGLLDIQTGLLHSSAEQFEAFLKKHPFLYLQNSDKKRLATLDSRTLLLWNNSLSTQRYSNSAANNKLNNLSLSGIKNWNLPSRKQLKHFASHNLNPYRSGADFRLKVLDQTKNKSSNTNVWNTEFSYASNIETLNKYYDNDLIDSTSAMWLVIGGMCAISQDDWPIIKDAEGYIVACNDIWENISPEKIIANLIDNDWSLTSPKGDSLEPDTSLQSSSLEQLQAKLALKNYLLTHPNDPKIILDPSEFLIDQQLVDLDYTPCRLPKLDASQIADPSKGIWELWGQDATTLDHLDYTARDPFKDVQRHAVAIDFGTSSTVVAMDTANGAQELLRIGVRDFYQAVEAKHFENPTVLECLDFSAFNQAWQSQAYRPELNWDWMRVAHEAQASFRDNPGDTNVLASIMPRLKQWALRSSEDYLVRITGRQGVEIEIPHHTERNPVRGQPIDVDSSDIFDPIEIYAWYLGMAINWRGRGLFLKYNLSFPVKYPLEVKNRILASFRRGLQRSLPASLIEHYPQVLNDFTVTDLASEPAAYAAAALQHLGIEPTDDGIVYAVFDFGGGTSDFDFGILRWATEAEEDQGYDRVFEHLASSGDNFLGGENLLEHLVYESFKNNLDALRQDRIQFTKPLDTKTFAGSEAFIAATQAAQTNTIMLAAKLRPFMEEENPQLDSQLKLDLIDVNGNKKLCVLNLEEEALTSLLAGRIVKGLQAFLAQLAKVTSQLTQQQAAAPIHFLLAGNGSHSRHMQALCEEGGKAWKDLCQQAFGEERPDIHIYPPLPMDDANPHAPTAKTGVALGLLQVAPGKNTLLINSLKEQQDGQAPFNWYVGRMRRNAFKPLVEPQAAYDEWFDIGPLQDSVFNLLTSSSPRALTGLAMGDPELTLHPLEFPSAPSQGARLFIRIIAPNQLEIAAATSTDELQHCSHKKLQLG